MNTWNGNIRQYESKDAKSNRVIIIIIILLFGVIFYKISKADAKPDIAKQSNKTTHQALSNDIQTEETDEYHEGVLSASSTVFTIDTFFHDIESSFSNYSFTLEDTTFSWNYNYGSEEIEGERIWAYIQVGDFKLDSECKQYLQNAGFTISVENAGGSDAGESRQGFTNNSQVCVLETQTTDNAQKSLYKVVCGNI